MRTTMRTMPRTALAIAAVSAALCCEVPSSRAQTYGDAPWCAVTEIGDGEVEWDCEYRTVEQCAPNVVAGNRGFCALNPYYEPAPAAPRAPGKRQLRHKAAQ